MKSLLIIFSNVHTLLFPMLFTTLKTMQSTLFTTLETMRSTLFACASGDLLAHVQNI